MFRLVSLILCIGLTTFCNAQGSWDIGYIHVDSINETHIGRVVRIDFKSINSGTSPNGQLNIRSYVGTKDTSTLTIDTTLFVLAERRKIYVDHGSYSDQFLECISCKDGAMLIYDSKIIEVNKNSILFQLDIETTNRTDVKRKETKFVGIDRSKLDGVMYKF